MTIDKIVYLDKKKRKEIEKITEILQGWELEKLYGKNLTLIACEAVLNSNLRRTIKAINNAETEIAIEDSTYGRTLLTRHGERCSFYKDNSHIGITHKNRHYVEIGEEEIIDENITISPLSKAGELCYDSEIVRTIFPHIGFSPSILLKTILHQVRENGQSIITKSEYGELGKAKVKK